MGLSQALLQIENLKTVFQNTKSAITVVDDISFSMNKGETLALVGESGCGKSMTSLSIMGLLPGTGKIAQGKIMFEGNDLTKKSVEDISKIRGNKIAMIFQEPMTSLNPVLKIGDQMTEGLILHHKLSKKEAEARAIERLNLVGFARAADIMNEYPHQLSGGMRQRVMIAMAMSTDPQLLIADEPTTALDVTIQAQVLELMRDVKAEFETSILLITHDLGVVAEMADRVVVMYAGKVVEEASVFDVFEKSSHPYTEGLLKSVPNLEADQTRLYSIRGNVPTPEEFPIGCRFAPRCDKAMDHCFDHAPDLYRIGDRHQVRCFLYHPEKGTFSHE
nr:ABC transporter ATP-binding protein [Thermoactinomyces sp. DSM 45892]